MYSYIHIPFCESKCKYCRFASIGNTNQVMINKYVAHLINDIKNFKTDLGKKSVLNGLKSIYFGGGTPSILDYKELNLIISSLKDKFNFRKNIEITLETTPNNITEKNLKNWENLGINRISIGVQTLNDKALHEIGRDNKGDILKSLELLKNSKIKNISVDFIIGLPHVKKGETLKNIKYILEKFPFIKHVSVYMLEDYYEVTEDKAIYEKIKYPNSWHNTGINEDFYLKEYLSIKRFLEKKSFNFYELSNSSKKGFECKHNKSYWNHSNNVGFGLGSHSFLNNKRYAYSQDFLSYYNGKLEYEETLSKNDLFLEKILFSLRTKGIGKNLQKKLDGDKISALIKSGFLKKNSGKIILGNKGFTLLDYIIKEII